MLDRHVLRKKLGQWIVLDDISARFRLLVPEQYQDRADILLVAQFPFVSFEREGKGGKDWLVKASGLVGIEGFPKHEDWYPVDPEFGLPCGAKSSALDAGARFLGRLDRNIGLVARDFSEFGGYENDTRFVFMNARPSHHLGMVVEGTHIEQARSDASPAPAKRPGI
jgi:hypothetical protein